MANDMHEWILHEGMFGKLERIHLIGGGYVYIGPLVKTTRCHFCSL